MSGPRWTRTTYLRGALFLNESHGVFWLGFRLGADVLKSASPRTSWAPAPRGGTYVGTSSESTWKPARQQTIWTVERSHRVAGLKGDRGGR